MSYAFTKAAQLQELCAKYKVPISEIATRYEMETTKSTEEEIVARMKTVLAVMGKAIIDGKSTKLNSPSGMVGGDAYTFDQAVKADKIDWLMSDVSVRAMTFSIATNESNACSNCIVACPTAGSAGIIPASLFAVREKYQLDQEGLVRGLLNTSAIGIIIEANAMMSGAEGGCQSEDGSAACMAASAITEMRGGTVEQCLHAAALSLKNVLGLVCDPIGGLVEVPCVKRTAFMVMNAFTASDLVMGGVRSVVPFDEVVDAMRRIGEAMPSSLRETAQGGLATTKTGRQVKEEMAKAKARGAATGRKKTSAKSRAKKRA
jgi:L-serine dehydratase